MRVLRALLTLGYACGSGAYIAWDLVRGDSSSRAMPAAVTVDWDEFDRARANYEQTRALS